MKPPKIDARDKQDILRQMQELALYYTPEWRVSLDHPDPGAAMMQIVGDMLKKTVDRLNQVPLNHFIAFLNLLDVSLLQAHPASAYLRFQLVEGAEEPVLVPAGTKVAAESETEGDAIIFETEHPLLVTPAELSAVYQVSTMKDMIRLSNEFPVAWFPHGDADNLQQHMLYIAHAGQFNLRYPALIELQLEHSRKRFTEEETCRKLVDPAHTEWQYRTETGWKPFDRAESDGNRIRLYKSETVELQSENVNEIEQRWIRCVMRPGDQYDEYLAEGKLEWNGMRLHTSFDDPDRTGGFPPDRMFFDDMELGPDQFLPFGEYFAPYGSFYLSSQEAFSKKRSRVTLRFQLHNDPRRLLPDQEEEIDWKMIMKKSQFEKKDPTEVSILQVLWEYWDGQGWVRLTTDRTYERIFYRPDASGQEHEMEFDCPDDIEETFVNAQYNYWIRARIVSIENLYAIDTLYLTPRMSHVRLAYRYDEQPQFLPEQCWTYNNLEYRDRTHVLAHALEPFSPFYSFDTRRPACYFGFENPPLKGPISLYVSIRSSREGYVRPPVVDWEYLSHDGGGHRWKSLVVQDGTAQLTTNGTIRFSGPPDMAEATMFGRGLFWIRAVNLNGVWDESDPAVRPPTLEAIHLNCIRSLQQETVIEEIPEIIEDGFSRTYVLGKSPVVEEEVWVDETGTLTEEEVAELEREGTPLEVIRDSDRQLQRVWVRWEPVDQLYDSAADSRHYMIERTNGRLRFGDGVLGKALPNSGEDKIKVNYKFVSGKAGNVPAGTITVLQSAIAFIQSVYNPEPAAGGSDMESLKEAMQRGPQLFKHRNRAVTANDFEVLARQAYPNIAKAKCLAHYNARMEKEPGAITLAVLTKESAGSSLFFAELQKEVRAYLQQRAACNIAFDGQIEVVEAAGLEVSVQARIVVDSIESVISAEQQAEERLAKFLNPHAGHYDGNGWEIGDMVHPSMFFGLLKSVREVNHVENISMTVHLVEGGERRELRQEEIGQIPHGIVMNGKHQIWTRVVDDG